MRKLLGSFLMLALVSVISCTSAPGSAPPPKQGGEHALATPQSSDNVAILQIYSRSRYQGPDDPFPNLPMARRGEEILLFGAGFKTGEYVRIYVGQSVAVATIVENEMGTVREKFPVFYGEPSDDPNQFSLVQIEAVGDKGSRAVALIMAGQ